MPFEPEINYWKHKLRWVKPLNLFTDSARSDKKGNNKHSSEFVISEKLKEQLTRFSDEQKVSLFVTLLSAYKVLLYRYSSQDDICVGNVICNAGVNSGHHNHLNILPLRTEINNSNSFEELLQSVNTTVNDAYQHQNVPFDKLTGLLSEDTDLSSNPLYQVMFILQNGVAIPSGHTLESDITLFVKEEDSELKGRFEYNSGLYKEDTISRIIDHYKILLGSILANPKKNIGLLPILTEVEERKLLYELNNTAFEYPKDKSLIDLFEEQVKKTPDNIAVIFNELEINYKELNSLSNQFGDYLRKTYQIKPDDIIGLKLERGEWLIIAIIGILKAGGAYVPIDPDYPLERINYMINDSACKVLVDRDELERFKKVQNNYDRENLKGGAKANNLVYCIYTSGSTGNPKGVLVEHRNVVNLIWSQREVYKITSNERVLQFTTITFDPSAEQFWIAFLTGAALVAPDKSTISDLKALENYIIVKKVSHIHTVPAVLTELSIDDMSNVKRVITGGESCSPSLVEKWKGCFMFINEYGPTETTITSVEYKAEQADNYHVFVPIGRPVANTDIYILDDNLCLLPFGALGEVYIGGDGVSRGYLNRPELTKEKFINDPFKPEKRVYRTGDLGRWLPDGNIEYLGRIDDQVKIRGFRIELDEITATLLKHPKVNTAVVIAKAVNGQDKELIAYTTGDAEGVELRDSLKDLLPSYMVPAYYVQMDSIPLTSNGKVDKKILPIPSGHGLSDALYIAPSTDIELVLTKIWAEVLNLPEKAISIKSDFFDLGGHSIKATRLRGLIHKKLGVKLAIKELFLENTIELQAKSIADKEVDIYEAKELVAEQPDYILSPAQRRLWVLQQLDISQSAYNIPYVVKLEGNLDKLALEKSIRAIIIRHEALRTVFKEDEEGNPRQQIINPENYEFKLKETDLRKTADNQSVLNRLIEKETTSGFSLSSGPLLRCHLIQLDENTHVLIIVHHHIISDEWSMTNFRQELSVFYNAYLENTAAQLSPLRIQYKDYAAWHNQQLGSDEMVSHKEYWLSQFEGEIPVLNLPADKERPASKTFKGASLAAKIDHSVLDKLNKAGKASGSTMFMNLLACVNVLFYRYTGQEDIVIGSLIGGRDHSDLDDQIGYYINTLALRTRFDGSGSYEDVLKQVKEVTFNAYEHQLYPYNELVDLLKLPRNINRNPLFDVMVTLRSAMEQDAEFTIAGLKTSQYDADESRAIKYDVNFIFSESKAGLDLCLEFNTDIYSTEQMKRMLKHFENIIAAVAQNPKQYLSAIDLLGKEEKKLLLDDLNNTSVDFPSDKTIVDLFEDQVKKTPGNPAVIFEDIELSYQELNFVSNQLGDYLRKTYKVKPDDLIGLKLDRSEWMVIAILGILKSGGAYVPISPDYPHERINYLIKDSECKLIIDEGELEKFQKVQNRFNQENQSVGLEPRHLAYCIYTSGSTGAPKGCLIQHNSLVNRLSWMQRRYPLIDNDAILQKTTFVFDVSVWELLWWATQGACVCILKDGEEKNPEAIINAIDDHKITVMHFVPSMLNVFLEFLESDKSKLYQLKNLRQVFVSGEALTVSQAERFKELLFNRLLVNLYGPTETCIDVTSFDCNSELLKSTVPIGKPIDNTQIYILDKHRNLLPFGATGEICIGGAGLARGYLNHPGLTDEKFISNPFVKGAKIYCSGDFGRWKSDGNLEYLGRADDQVKIRGYRIELQEISSVLRKHPKVKEAIVIAATINETDSELIAYTAGGATAIEIKDYLKEQLPLYMVPGYYVHLDAIPITNTGKVDRKALPVPKSSGIFKPPHIAPSTEIEKSLVKLWARVLNISEKSIGLKNDFFDMGGHSIKAIRLLALIHKELGVKLPLNELFSKGTIEHQASMITSGELNTYGAIESIPEAEEYKLSSAQKRLWILNHFEGAQSAYNIPYVISLEGHLNTVALADAFKAMALRHEILRTNFKESATGVVFQEVINPDKYAFELKETDLTKNTDKYSVLNQIIELESFGGFDFIEGPLWRCHLVQLADDKHILIMVHHHIISDGWSMDIFRKEWCALYNAYSTGITPQLAPLRIQYKDYAAWHNKYLQSDDLIPHKDYWLKQFEGEIPILELPAEKERPAIKTFNGTCITTTIDNNVLDKLNRTGKALGGTLFMSLLACVNALMYRYTGQEDVVIGSPIAGREHPDLENQLGFYINTLAIRTRFDGLGNYEALFERVKEVTLSAYEHQVYPYDELVDSLKLPRNINRNPLFDVMVVLQNSMEQDAVFTLNGLHTSQYKTGQYRVAKFDINFIFSESKNGLELFLEYNTDIYGTEQVRLMLRHLENLIAAVVQDPKQSLAAIDILTREDKHQLFDVFNNTLVHYPKEKTLADIFEEQVLRTPDAIALRQHEESMTYRELNEQANQLAHYLIQNGVNKGDNIALLVTRNFHMIVGMFGILKAGGAYVPIDPEYPIDRQEYILQNSSVKKVITDGEYPLAALVSPELFVRLKETDLSTYNKENPGLKINSTQLAYTIYTSGSTGRPKGVMIEHHMAVNLILWVNTEFNVGPDDRLLFITSMCFDLSVYDIFGMLSAGGSLVIVQQNELLDVPRLKDMMLSYKITFWDTVPTTMDYLVRELEAHDKSFLQKTLRVVFMSGDWIPVNLPDRIKVYFPATRVISLGGATEGTVWSNFYPVEKVGANWGSIPYGRPMNNNFFYILNEKLQPAPIGVVGELYIGGVGVARGYANDKEKTDYAFVKDPFSDKAGGRMYRTGDLGRMLPDLNMEFIGRKDDQVKIRGYRIELGEIESVLRQCEQVSQAVVLAKADKDKKKRLVGYVVGKENYDRASVIAFLKSKLPDYMVPTLWMEVDNIPLTANGKIDKKSLPEFNAEEQIKDQYVAPRTESERLLVKIWEDVLRVSNIGVTHDFFDLGGHSLLAVQIVNQIKKHTGKILPISILFKYSNIESLNAFLNENDTEKVSKSLVPIKPSGNKMPVYFIHGVGLNVMNFADLAMYLDKEQPVFGIQALGLGGKFPPVTTISEIAKIYVSEIIEHNPNGPYALAGYSLGGFIATEMRKQFEALNKEVSVLAIIDTYADYTDDFLTMLPKKLDRHIRKWIDLGISFIRNPNKTIQKQKSIYLEDKQYRYDAIKLAKESGDQEFYKLMKYIRSTYYDSYRKSKMEPFNGFVHLFRATECLHYTDDKVYLGWRKYALKGMKEFLIPGDHRTMLLKPNVEVFAKALQEVLDNAGAETNKKYKTDVNQLTSINTK